MPREIAPDPCKPALSSNALNFKIWFSSSFRLFLVETLAEGMSHTCKMLESPCPMYPAASVQWDFRSWQVVTELCHSLFYFEEPVLHSET